MILERDSELEQLRQLLADPTRRAVGLFWCAARQGSARVP